MESLKKIFLRNPYAPAFWLLLGLIFKSILFFAVIFNHPYRDIAGIWGATQADDSSYLTPIDNLLHYGIYTPDFRMPGYGFPYLIFHLFFSQAGACNSLLLLQLLLASASVYYLALTALLIFKDNSVFYIAFYLFLVCSYSNFFDAYIASESLCTSFLIFSIYFFTRYFREQKNKYLLFAGLLATWVIFIRPVFGGITVACCCIILFQKNMGINSKVKHVFLFLIPFILCEGSWIIRNFRVHNKFIPFTITGSFYPNEADSYLEPLFDFVQSWGGVCTFTDRPPDLDWFQYHYPGMKPITRFDSLPDNIYTSAFNKDSLIRLKKMILWLQNPALDTSIASIYQRDLRAKLNKYRLSERQEKPLVYFVKAPLKMIGEMLYGPATRLYLDRGQSVPVFGRTITTFNYIIYLFILLTGLAGSIGLLILSIKQKSFLLIIPFIPLYTILIHPFLLRFFDNRFLMPAFPVLIICSGYIISKTSRKITGKTATGMTP